MNRWILGLSLLLAPLCPASKAEEPEPLKVCLISGSWEYKSEETLPAFQSYLERNYPVDCTLLQATERDQLPGLEALDDCDVALFFTRRLTIDGEPLAMVKEYVTSGRPIVGVRTASHGFQNWLEMDAMVFGGNYHGHYRNDLTTEVTVAPDASDHPVLESFDPYTTIASLYQVSPLADDCRVLLIGTSPEGREPVAWTREFNGGRIVYTSLGHPDDFDSENFRRFLADALFWAADRESDRP